MSAHDVAIAALNEVASNARSATENKANANSHAPDIDLATKNNGATGNSMEKYPSRSASLLDGRNVHLSYTAPSGSSNNSQTTADAPTPPTSEEPSSQSQELQLDQLSQLAAAQRSIWRAADTGRADLPLATNAGQKRTHDGYRKQSSSSESDSPTVGRAGGHSRNTSTVSAAESTASTREVILLNSIYPSFRVPSSSFPRCKLPVT